MAAGLLTLGIGAASLISIGGSSGAGAAGLVPTTSVETLSPSTIYVGGGVEGGFKMSSTIEPLGVVLGAEVLPTGSVTFTAEQGNGPITTLGSGSVPACLGAVITVTACTAAIIRYPALTAGTWTIHANYSGDSLMAASKTTATLTVLPVPGGDQQFCAAGEEFGNCFIDVNSPDNSTNFSIQQQTDVDTTLTAFFGGPGMACSSQGPPGDIVNFASTDTNDSDTKSLDYEIFGPAATTLNTKYPFVGEVYPNGPAPICYGSLNPFTAANGSPAPFVNGEYEGLLPICNGENTPCENGTNYYNGEGGPSFTYYIDTLGGDPRVGGA